MKKFALLVSLLFIPSWVFAENCDYSRDYDFAVDAAVLDRLSMDVGAGMLTVNGDSATNEVSIIAKACASSSRRLDEIALEHRVRGSELFVVTEHNPKRGIFSWLSFGNSYIDIEVTMPNDLALEVDDGSGASEIAGTSMLTLDDGSGPIRIENITGDVFVEDGSGSITISAVNGKVSVSDGSGPISIRDSYEVTIVDDGSGDIDIENIRSNVTIYDDGSGSIRIHDVAGDVEIGDSGSGSVNVSGVAGNYSKRDD